MLLESCCFVAGSSWGFAGNASFDCRVGFEFCVLVLGSVVLCNDLAWLFSVGFTVLSF